ncbi:unnamed protein product, partial [Cyprideis torosa]
MDTLTIGGGCFWCIEAIFEELHGVEKVVSGYSGDLASVPSSGGGVISAIPIPATNWPILGARGAFFSM